MPQKNKWAKPATFCSRKIVLSFCSLLLFQPYYTHQVISASKKIFNNHGWLTAASPEHTRLYLYTFIPVQHNDLSTSQKWPLRLPWKYGLWSNCTLESTSQLSCSMSTGKLYKTCPLKLIYHDTQKWRWQWRTPPIQAHTVPEELQHNYPMLCPITLVQFLSCSPRPFYFPIWQMLPVFQALWIFLQISSESIYQSLPITLNKNRFS